MSNDLHDSWQQWTLPCTPHPIDARTVDHVTVQKTRFETGGASQHFVEIKVGTCCAVFSMDQIKALSRLLDVESGCRETRAIGARYKSRAK